MNTYGRSSTAAQRLADDPLRVAEPVGRGGVDPVHSQLQRPVDRGDRLVIGLRPPAALPATADCPRAEAHAGDLQAGAAQRAGPKLCLLHVSSSALECPADGTEEGHFDIKTIPLVSFIVAREWGSLFPAWASRSRRGRLGPTRAGGRQGGAGLAATGARRRAGPGWTYRE